MDEKPLPPNVLVGALQDSIHEGAGKTRIARTMRTPMTDNETIAFGFVCALWALVIWRAMK